MREFIIQENDANQRLDKFITKAIPLLPKGLMYKSIRNKKIKVNRKRCEISTRLNVGDVVHCFIAEEFFEDNKNLDFLQVPADLKVVYEDDDVIVIDKPHGLLSHKDSKEIQDNAQDRLLHYLYLKNKQTEVSFTPAFVHRLDRNTTGLMIAGKKAESLRLLNEAMKEHTIHKYYLCIVEGVLSKNQDTIVCYHQKLANNQAKISFEPIKDASKIQTSYRVLKRSQTHTMLEVELHGGKSHQIRSVLSAIGHPLIGDVKYGAKKDGSRHYHHLLAYRLYFDFEYEALPQLNKQEITCDKNSMLTLWKKINQK